MNINTIEGYCLLKPHVEKDLPFDNTTLVFKVAGKIFVIIALDGLPLEINLKCEPQKAIVLREEFESIRPGYHMNKKHWNTITLDPSISFEMVKNWIDHSYEMVIAGFSKKKRKELQL